ncbi:MAG TPA: prepilin-type N-terminal cleavage/methylation domain-containing protein [Myxococcota bacterium]|nr:prepilin-type N-terminal cleavage/methylation domain-containing protein [Myxococcota bacterium]
MIRRYRKRRRKDSGFTLIELMVVVAIVAIVTAAVVPSFSMSLQRNRQREAGLLIVQAVFAARSRAARTGHCEMVEVTLAKPGLDGGTGGIVSLREYRPATAPFDCGIATADGLNWVELSHKSVSRDGTHPGVVGGDGAKKEGDVAIDGFSNVCVKTPAAPGVVTMFFEPTGGQEATTAQEYFFGVTAYQSPGVPRGVQRHVRVSAGGSVRYTFCPPPP